MTINFLFILRKSVYYSVNLCSNRYINSATDSQSTPESSKNPRKNSMDKIQTSNDAMRRHLDLSLTNMVQYCQSITQLWA